MFWWFERDGAYTRCEVLDVAGVFELRIVNPDGTEETELFSDATELAKRQDAVIDALRRKGWTGPHGWVL